MIGSRLAISASSDSTSRRASSMPTSTMMSGGMRLASRHRARCRQLSLRSSPPCTSARGRRRPTETTDGCDVLRARFHEGAVHAQLRAQGSALGRWDVSLWDAPLLHSASSDLGIERVVLALVVTDAIARTRVVSIIFGSCPQATSVSCTCQPSRDASNAMRAGAVPGPTRDFSCSSFLTLARSTPAPFRTSQYAISCAFGARGGVGSLRFRRLARHLLPRARPTPGARAALETPQRVSPTPASGCSCSSKNLMDKSRCARSCRTGSRHRRASEATRGGARPRRGALQRRPGATFERG
jgi:hypothetical protein